MEEYELEVKSFLKSFNLSVVEKLNTLNKEINTVGDIVNKKLESVVKEGRCQHTLQPEEVSEIKHYIKKMLFLTNSYIEYAEKYAKDVGYSGVQLEMLNMVLNRRKQKTKLYAIIVQNLLGIKLLNGKDCR